MNMWFKVGLPVLIAALLVISAVGITMAVANGYGNQVFASSNDTGVTTNSRLSDGPCGNCTGSQGKGGTGNQSTTCQGNCGGNCGYEGTNNGCQGNCTATGNQNSCCGAEGQTVSPRTSRGGCCGTR